MSKRSKWSERGELPWQYGLADDDAFRRGLVDDLVREFGPVRDTESERFLADIERRGGVFIDQMGDE